MHQMEEKLDRIEIDLNLVKSSGGIKIFIDFFFKWMEFKDKLKYQIKGKR